MKKLNILYACIAIMICSLAACKKNFGEINTDPNRPQQITPGVMLGQLQYKLVNASMTTSKSFTHELMQVTAPRYSTSGGYHRYVITPATGAGIWSSLYGSMTDVEDMYKIADRLNEPNYKAISLIYKSWAYSILTDCFGSVPYTEATRATEGIVKPKFDNQKDIYVQLLKDLETANSLINTSKILTYGGDLVYNTSVLTDKVNLGMLKWKKFCNSLKLRLLLRISKRNGEINVNEQINAILTDPVKYPVFTDTADDAIFRYPGSYPWFNPYYNARPLDWQQGDYFTIFFIDKMNADADPRRGIWATQVLVNGVNVYQGIRSGYESTLEYPTDANSSYKNDLKTLPQLGVMMTTSELEFIKAELALKGFTTGNSAKNHYEKGITASMKQWGTAIPADYLQKNGVAYNETASADLQLQQIMLQKYYAYFFNDYQSWFEKRRTGYPILPRGTGIPAENQFPSRLLYPTYLQSINAENLAAAVNEIGGDKSNVKSWWEK